MTSPPADFTPKDLTEQLEIYSRAPTTPQELVQLVRPARLQLRDIPLKSRYALVLLPTLYKWGDDENTQGGIWPLPTILGDVSESVGRYIEVIFGRSSREGRHTSNGSILDLLDYTK